jgi:hypothetical protein
MRAVERALDELRRLSSREDGLERELAVLRDSVDAVRERRSLRVLSPPRFASHCDVP